MVTLDLADGLEVEATAEDAVSIRVSGPRAAGVPSDGRNLAVRAAEAVRAAAGSRRGLRLLLRKEVPAGAGLGGGSSDGAAALLAADRVLGAGLSAEALQGLAAGLGSDVPFFLRGGTALARGRGDLLTPLAAPPPLRFLLLFPGAPASTRAVYARCRPAEGEAAGVQATLLLAALASGDPAEVSRACFNRLAAAAAEVCPAVRDARRALEGLGLGPSHVTGSGSACFLVLPEGVDEADLLRRLEPAVRGLPAGAFAAVVRAEAPGDRP